MQKRTAGCPCPGDNYTIAQIGGSIVPGTTDIGNHADDVVTTIALPFSVTIYNHTFNSVALDSNGKAHFLGGGSVFTNSCLPQSEANYSVYPYWDDQRTDVGLAGCSNFASGCGIFTSVTGSAPNRIFNVEWRTVYFNSTLTANYELRLYEGQSRFDVIYGTLGNGNTSATAGAQRDSADFDQYFCNGSGGAATGGQSYTLPTCMLTVNSAVSRKTHGGTGNFDVDLPLTGTPGIECRSGGGTNDFTMVVTFAGNVSVTGSPQAEVTSGSGTIGSGGVGNGGMVTVSGNTVTIPLTNINNAQTINVTLNGVNDGTATGNVVIPMSRLLGDTTANGTVSSADISQTKGQTGQTTNGSNFRTDVNASGSISSADISQVKAASGTSLPPLQ